MVKFCRIYLKEWPNGLPLWSGKLQEKHTKKMKVIIKKKESKNYFKKLSFSVRNQCGRAGEQKTPRKMKRNFALLGNSLTRWTLWMMRVLLLGWPLLCNAPPSRALMAVSTMSPLFPFWLLVSDEEQFSCESKILKGVIFDKLCFFFWVKVEKLCKSRRKVDI